MSFFKKTEVSFMVVQTISEIYNNQQVGKMEDDDLLLVSKKNASNNSYTSAGLKFNKLVDSIVESSFENDTFYLKYSNGIVIEGGKTLIPVPETINDFERDFMVDVILPVSLTNPDSASSFCTGHQTNTSGITVPFPSDYDCAIVSNSKITIAIDHSACVLTTITNIVSDISNNSGTYTLGKTFSQVNTEVRESILEALSNNNVQLKASWLVIGKWK